MSNCVVCGEILDEKNSSDYCDFCMKELNSTPIDENLRNDGESNNSVNQIKSEENIVALILKVVAYHIFILGFVIAISVKSEFDIIKVVGISLFSGLLLLGISEIISLLQRILNNSKK